MTFLPTLIDSETPFVTWEKHIDTSKLVAIDDSQFYATFELNGKDYSIFEDAINNGFYSKN